MGEYLKIEETTALRSLKVFVKVVVSIFSEKYLSKPNNDDIVRLLAVGEKHGFIGSHSDINVLDRSFIFSNLAQGNTPTVNYTINGHNYVIGYYFADGIYPQWTTFVKTISVPQGNKKKYFAAAQKSARKDVESAFGVLQARFAIIRGPAPCFHIETLNDIMMACVILHNMIIEDERMTMKKKNLNMNSWQKAHMIQCQLALNLNLASSFNIIMLLGIEESIVTPTRSCRPLMTTI
ncbi:hypothetical protein F2P56_034909 [Juglans regia]|uniref:Protein ALP1-like n=2 Tax=Juglans regia TaxID=51240 RepID=A0A833WSC4_JUGRE|nr:uncharacterized protein LOC109014186 [Juglans regia]KAF5442224.1 hypothetical protein F2P56_034909 [Juglans regia]